MTNSTPSPVDHDPNDLFPEEAEWLVHDDLNEISQEEIKAMTQEERLAKVAEYRKYVTEDRMKLSKRAHSNAMRVLRAVRSRAIEMNPRTKKTTKKKAAASFDLSQFMAKK